MERFFSNKKINKSRQDIKGFYVCTTCTGSCTGSCSGSCSGMCNSATAQYCGSANAW